MVRSTLKGIEVNDVKKIISVIIIGLNAVVILFSLGTMGVGAYMQTHDWGSLSGTHVADISTIMLLIGFVFMILTIMNLFGMCAQNIVNQRNFLSGRRVLLAHYFSILAVVLLELYSLSWIMHSKSDLRHAKHLLGSGIEVSYGSLETQFANRMNAAFFAASDCVSTDVDYTWFWNWIDDNCANVGVQEMYCACESYNENLCTVDEHGCGAGSLDVCPYELCRLGALSYILGFLKALFILNIVITIVHFSQVLLNGSLVCYMQHDSMYEILVGNGYMKGYDSITHTFVDKSTHRGHKNVISSH